jgi:hypothetical protein
LERCCGGRRKLQNFATQFVVKNNCPSASNRQWATDDKPLPNTSVIIQNMKLQELFLRQENAHISNAPEFIVNRIMFFYETT